MIEDLLPNCTKCIHFNKSTMHTCKAYPNGIPDAIMNGEILHDESIGGDNGIIYEYGDYSI